MTQAIDFTQSYTIVGGKPPVAFMQDGKGYARSGRFLGACNVQGDLVSTGELPPAAGPDNNDDGVSESQAMKVPELKADLKVRGIEIPEGAKKADLVALREQAIAGESEKEGGAEE